jgi:uncharacterized protein YjdB
MPGEFQMTQFVSAQTRRSVGSVAIASLAALTLAACSSSSDSVSAPKNGAPTRLDVSTNGLALDGVGATDSVRATVRDAEGNATTATVTWTVENAAIATVNASGSVAAVVGKSAGVTHLRATAAGFTSDVEIRVIGVKGLTLETSAVSLRVGDAQQIAAIFDADPSAKRGLTFSSSNAAVASVNADGFVSGITAGTATIKVSSVADARISATATITVNPARAVSFAPGLSAVTLWAGDTRTLSADADVDANQTHGIVWTIENTDVATISENGELAAVAPGTTIIHATSAADPRAQASLVLTVLPARSVTVAPDAFALSTGAQQQLAATVVIEKGLSTNVTWISSDSTVASVNADGLVTAVGPGSATITATSVVDTSRTGSASVTVTDAPAGGIVRRATRKSK